ncbi:MAG: SDR family NAD(P)-dependent oxidoreductase [Proteobacteria bacterium]|nr:SDR family NAD(P)-dependent oxidoreductase [Pseudomonadota bacterium]
MSTFNAESTTNDVIQGISLSGKVAVVTGASSGLGVETVRILAGAGATVLMLARNKDKLQGVAQDLREANPGASIDTEIVDLADLDSVRRAAAAIVDKYPAIDILINNAGVMACPLARTAQGFEMQFGTNHLGHFLFACLLVPALTNSARVISLSSGGHKFGRMDFDDPNYQQRNYEKWSAYGQSKTANALFAIGLDDRLKSRGVRALAVHPGVIMTELSRHMAKEDFDLLSARLPEGQEMTLKSVEQGAATSVWAATSPALAGEGGVYLEDCHIAQAATPEGEGGVESYALDHADADRLWVLSEELVGQVFTF